MIRPLATKASVPTVKREAFSRSRREQLALGNTQPKENVKTKNKSRITVTVRKKPLLESEKEKREIDILRTPSKKLVLIEEPRKDVTGAPVVSEHDFEFDRVYDQNCSNQQVYFSCVKTLVDAVFLEKAKCSCFAFGQTGSGKTYTMVGAGKGRHHRDIAPEEQGLWEWAAKDMTRYISEPEFKGFGLYVSFFEIYCNKVYDLLNDRNQVKALDSKTAEGVVVKDLTTLPAASEPELLALMDKGLAARTVGKNSRNADSSRSHALLTIEVKHMEQMTLHGKMAFVDLAGSERGADTLQQGRATQQDGAGINKSLLALKECIRAMDQGLSHIPFRDSELTKVLRDMFMTDSGLTLMIATVSSSSSCCEQTLNTLRYADRVFRQRKFAKPCIAESDAEEDTAETAEAAHFQGQSGLDSNDVASAVDDRSEASFSSSDDDADFGEESPSTRMDRTRAMSSTHSLNEVPAKTRQAPSPRIIKESKGIRPTRIKQSNHAILPGPLPPTNAIGEQNSEDEMETVRGERRPVSSIPTRGSLSRSGVPPSSPRVRSRYNGDASEPTEVAQAVTYRVGQGLRQPPPSERALTATRRQSSKTAPVKAAVQPASRPTRKLEAKPSHSDRMNRQLSLATKEESSHPINMVSEDSYLTPGSFSRRMIAGSQPAILKRPDSISSQEVLSDTQERRSDPPAAQDESDSSSLYSPDEMEPPVVSRTRWIRADDLPESGAPLIESQSQQPGHQDVSRVIQEPVSPDLMELVRQVLPTVDPTSLLSRLDEEADEEFKSKQQLHAGSAWEAYSRFLDLQHAHLRDSASLCLFHVKLSRELDTPEQSKSNTGRLSMSTAAKTVGINPEKVRLVRLIIEKQLAGLISLGQALVDAEAGLSNCRRLDNEAKQRSMRSVQYYQAGSSIGLDQPVLKQQLTKESRKKSKKSVERL